VAAANVLLELLKKSILRYVLVIFNLKQLLSVKLQKQADSILQIEVKANV